MTTNTSAASIPGGTSDHEELFRKAIEQKPELERVFELHPSASPNISNEIHPLFRRSNFPTLSLRQYEAFGLGLRLASLFITAEPMLEWWVHAAFGFRVPHPRNADKFVLEQAMEYNAGHTASVEAALVSLADFVDFDFDVYKGFFSLGRTSIREVRHPAAASPHGLFREVNRQGKRIITMLHADFQTYASKGFWEDPLDAQLRFSFLLAVTIVHEMTHAFGCMMRGTDDEEYVDADDPDTEWGFSWETWALGGLLNPWKLAVAPTTTFLSNCWESRTKKKANGGAPSSVVPMDWIARWFRRRFWTMLQTGHGVQMPPSCELQIWQRSNRRGSLMSDIELLPNDECRTLHRTSGTKRKVDEVDGADSGYGTAESEKSADENRRKRPRTESEEPVSPKTVKIDDS
ncbi:hypothetical protein SLS56_003722 [Neofusicoccum ribis]|uniref:Uncharacterized protein n=1 Tax=Neofusicoccum ribis TaxID=45134 RepID=A0ABR3SY92_9PEZI